MGSLSRAAIICKSVQDCLHRSQADRSVACVTRGASANQGETWAAGRDVTSPRFDPGFAHPARVYNVWLGGKDHFDADRKAAEDVIRLRSQVVASAHANRAFLARVMRFLVADLSCTAPSMSRPVPRSPEKTRWTCVTRSKLPRPGCPRHLVRRDRARRPAARIHQPCRFYPQLDR
jgi:hypothetical protein